MLDSTPFKKGSADNTLKWGDSCDVELTVKLNPIELSNLGHKNDDLKRQNDLNSFHSVQIGPS